MRNPRTFYGPLALGAPAPLREIPFTPCRSIHFFDPSNPKMIEKVPYLAQEADIVLGNLEDSIALDKKQTAREGLVHIARTIDFGSTPLWVRVNSLESPFFLDDVTEIVKRDEGRVEVLMLPKVDGPEDIWFIDRLLAQLEARHQRKKPILVHAILETATGVANVELIASSSPRLQGMSLGPADLAASRRMKTTRVGGGHPRYAVMEDPNGTGPRQRFQQDLWHYTLEKMVDACASNNILPFYGPFGDVADLEGCHSQFENAYILGCVGAWSLHPKQIEIANRVFAPLPTEVAHAKEVVKAIPDGSGVAMIDGKMQDDATWKQCRVTLDLAHLLAKKDPSLAAAYGFSTQV